jgi:hypothetical protein
MLPEMLSISNILRLLIKLVPCPETSRPAEPDVVKSALSGTLNFGGPIPGLSAD